MGAEVSLKKLVLLLLGIIIIIAGIRGKFGATLAVFLVPQNVE